MRTCIALGLRWKWDESSSGVAYALFIAVQLFYTLFFAFFKKNADLSKQNGNMFCLVIST